jgi:D-alanyl-D-alanine carboxypeptidase (penicillin-binding protein 5/6)
MHDTHYADTNGLSSQSVSSAADQLRVAMEAMAMPTFAAVVSQTSITLPIAGFIPNYVASIGTDGIVGVKSGFTQAAMGCLVMAADRRWWDGRTVLVMAAVTGQPGLDPSGHGQHGRRRRSSTPWPVTCASARSWPSTPRPPPWSPRGRPTPCRPTPTRSVTLLAWPGDAVRMTFTPAPVPIGARAGTLAGTVAISDGPERVRDGPRSHHGSE